MVLTTPTHEVDVDQKCREVTTWFKKEQIAREALLDLQEAPRRKELSNERYASLLEEVLGNILEARLRANLSQAELATLTLLELRQVNGKSESLQQAQGVPQDDALASPKMPDEDEFGFTTPPIERLGEIRRGLTVAIGALRLTAGSV